MSESGRIFCLTIANSFIITTYEINSISNNKPEQGASVSLCSDTTSNYHRRYQLLRRLPHLESFVLVWAHGFDVSVPVHDKSHSVNTVEAERRSSQLVTISCRLLLDLNCKWMTLSEQRYFQPKVLSTLSSWNFSPKYPKGSFGPFCVLFPAA